MILYVTGAILYFFVIILAYFILGVVKGVEQDPLEVGLMAAVATVTSAFWPVMVVGTFLVGVAYLISKKVGEVLYKH